MTNKEIEKIKQELCEIMKMGNLKKMWEQLTVLAGKLNAPIPENHPDFPLDSINKITRNIHNSLQTEMMLNACVSAEQSCELAKQSCELAKGSSSSAKWACVWAAVAAGVCFFGTIASWITVFIT